MDPLNLRVLDGVGLGIGAFVIRTIVIVAERRRIGQGTDCDSAESTVVLRALCVFGVFVSRPVVVGPVAFGPLLEQRTDSLDGDNSALDDGRHRHGCVGLSALMLGCRWKCRGDKNA
jgi:hypothetical protein